MKVLLFSPLASTSAIGRVTALVVSALFRQGDEVTVVRTERGQALLQAPHATLAPVISWTDEAAVRRVAQDADVLVYQIGNNYEFHCGGVHWLSMLPGVVCLHDFIVAHLFAGWAADRPEQARHILCSWYGESVAKTFFDTRDPRAFIENASRHHPMTEWVCAMAHAVISHSHWGMPRVERSCPGPTRVVPLPYEAPSAPEKSEGSIGSGPVQILTVGHANVNKRIESVIRAIGSSLSLRKCVRYRLCGRIEPHYAAELAQLARSQGVALTISGEIDDHGLQSALSSADIVCCLRWPSLEAASATAIEGLLYGKAVVVTDTGFYSELPDECVLKISASDEVAQLTAALERLAYDPAARRAMAARGQKWASETFNASNYAQQIAAMSALEHAAAPVIDMVNWLGDRMSEWGAEPELLKSPDVGNPLSLFGQRV